MTCTKKLAGTTALASLILAQSAAADVTPQQVWEDLSGYMKGYGYEVAATENTSGDVLTVTDITMTVPVPEEDFVIEMEMPEITFTADGGSVKVAWPASMPVTLRFSEDDEQAQATLLYETTDLDTTVSGTPGEIAWAYAAASTRITLDDLVVDGETIPREAARGEVVFDGLVGTSSMKTGALRDIAQQIEIGALSYDIAARDPDSTEDSMLLKGSMTGVAYSGTGTMPMEIDPEDPMALMSVMDVDGSLSYSGGSSQFNFVADDETVNFASSSSGGSLGMDFNPETWAYDFNVQDYAVQVQGGEIPFPVSLKAGELGGNFTVPVSRADDPQDVALGINFSDFEMNDLIWNMFDPGAQLPRDPATIAIDVTGKMRMLFDLFDPEQAEAMAMAEMPAELHEVTLNSLVVDAIGAVLTGSGAFTFDNTDLQTFDGVPRPEGELNAELSGANALIDKLVAMGIVPEDQAMGARMMMGMFAVAQGNDTLTSKIEINAQGHILANGQRIQ